MREKLLSSQTLPDFQQYLLSRKLVPVKSVTFYAYWASRSLTLGRSISLTLFIRTPHMIYSHVMRDMTTAPKSPLDLLLEESSKSPESAEA
jgi:hypothetical protein